MEKFLTRIPTASKTGTIAPIATNGCKNVVSVLKRSQPNLSIPVTISNTGQNLCDSEVPTKKKKYRQKYKQTWETDRVWLINVNMQAFCKYCNILLANDITHLDRHSITKKHISAMNAKYRAKMKQMSIVESAGRNKVFQNFSKELSMVMYCIQHSLPFATTDTMPKLFNFLNPTEKHVRCCSKKATAIINSVVGPYAKEAVATDLRSTFFSLIIDESTDITMKKCVVLIVRYIPEGKCSVVGRFFGLLEVEDETAQGLYNVIIKYFKELNVPLANMIGLATDNASVTQGKRNSVKKKFQEANKHLFYLGCTCHCLIYAHLLLANNCL